MEKTIEKKRRPRQRVVTNQKLYDSYFAKKCENIDLTGKVVAITGTSLGGIGEFIAKAAAIKQAKVILLLNRESERYVTAKKEIEGVASNETAVMAIPIDLLSFKSVKQAAEKINKIAKEHGGLDVLCCNAGIMAMNDDRTEDGYDVQIQVCHLSHALLTQKCMVSLEEAAATRGEARVVYQSCPTRYGLRDLDAKYFEKCEPMTLGGNNYNAAFMRYHMAKLANSTFAMALHIALQEKGSKVKSIGSDPGQATTNLQQTSTHMTGFILRLLNVGGRLGFSQSPADGSMSATVACFGKNIYSGDFIMPTGKTGLAGYPIKSIAMNLPIKNGWEKETLKEGNQKLIWEVTEKELGVLFDLQPETINHHQRSSETKSALLV